MIDKAAYMREYRKRPGKAEAHRAETRAYAESHRQERKEYSEAWRSERREKLSAIKLAAGCADCGYAEHSEALQFDHLPGTHKLFAIANAMSEGRPWDLIEAEISKCEVVCANCHAVRTADRRDW